MRFSRSSHPGTNLRCPDYSGCPPRLAQTHRLTHWFDATTAHLCSVDFHPLFERQTTARCASLKRCESWAFLFDLGRSNYHVGVLKADMCSWCSSCVPLGTGLPCTRWPNTAAPHRPAAPDRRGASRFDRRRCGRACTGVRPSGRAGSARRLMPFNVAKPCRRHARLAARCRLVTRDT